MQKEGLGNAGSWSELATRFAPGRLELQGLAFRPPVVEQIVGIDDRGRLRRQMLVCEVASLESGRSRVSVWVPGPGLFEARNVVLEDAFGGADLNRAFVYVAAHGARPFELSEVEAVARTLDAPRKPGRPRSWLRRSAVVPPTRPKRGAPRTEAIEPAGDPPGTVLPASAASDSFSTLGIGDVVRLLRPRWGQERATLAVCYEAFELAKRPGRAFVFPDGLTVGCDPEEFGEHFVFLRSEPSLAGLRVRDPRDLALALVEGRFASVFAATEPGVRS